MARPTAEEKRCEDGEEVVEVPSVVWRGVWSCEGEVGEEESGGEDWGDSRSWGREGVARV